MEKHLLKRRKKILRDIALGRYLFHIQPLEKLHSNDQACVEVLPYYCKFAKTDTQVSIFKDLEKDMSIVIFDMYVFEKICEVLQRWRQKKFREIRFHVHLSNVTIIQNDLDKQLEVIRNRYQVQPSNIAIIITYHKHEQASDKQIEAINKLHDVGYMMILESEENLHSDVLHKAMFSMVKYDICQFIKSMDTKRSLIYFYYLMKWCKDEQIDIMFKGIENEQQREYVQKLGCSYMAAPYLQKVLPLEEFELLLTRQVLVKNYENRK